MWACTLTHTLSLFLLMRRAVGEKPFTLTLFGTSKGGKNEGSQSIKNGEKSRKKATENRSKTSKRNSNNILCKEGGFTWNYMCTWQGVSVSERVCALLGNCTTWASLAFCFFFFYFGKYLWQHYSAWTLHPPESKKTVEVERAGKVAWTGGSTS